MGLGNRRNPIVDECTVTPKTTMEGRVRSGSMLSKKSFCIADDKFSEP